MAGSWIILFSVLDPACPGRHHARSPSIWRRATYLSGEPRHQTLVAKYFFSVDFLFVSSTLRIIPMARMMFRPEVSSLRSPINNEKNELQARNII